MPATKRRTNVSLDARLLASARELGLNLSRIAEEALAAAVREARAKAEENAEAIAQRAVWIEANGMPLARWQVWKPE